MPGLRIVLSTALATAALGLAATGCGDDDEPTAATQPGTIPQATVPAGTTPGATTPVQPPTSGAPQGASKAFGEYTLVINQVLRSSAEYAVAVQTCAQQGDKAKACVEDARKKLDEVEGKYDKAAAELAEDGSKACKDALGKSGKAVDSLLGVLRKIGDAASSGDAEDFNKQAQQIGTALQGQSADLVAGQSACSGR